MRNVRQLLPLVLMVLVAVPASAAPTVKTRDICIASPTGGGSFNTFVFRDVETLNAGGVVSLHGIFFTGARKAAPVHGTAAMGSDGRVTMGAFVHSTAQSVNDFTVAGVTDTNLVGTLNFDNDGDFIPNGTLAMAAVDCATIDIP